MGLPRCFVEWNETTREISLEVWNLFDFGPVYCVLNEFKMSKGKLHFQSEVGT